MTPTRLLELREVATATTDLVARAAILELISAVVDEHNLHVAAHNAVAEANLLRNRALAEQDRLDRVLSTIYFISARCGPLKGQPPFTLNFVPGEGVPCATPT